MLEVTCSLIKPHGRAIEQLNSLVGRDLHIAKLHIEDGDERINLSLGLFMLCVSSGLTGVWVQNRDLAQILSLSIRCHWF